MNCKNAVSCAKKNLRTVMKKKLHEFCSNRTNCDDASRRACGHLIQSSLFSQAETVLAYMAAPEDADCTAVIESALAAGKIVAVPRVISDTDMDFFVLDRNVPLDTQLVHGAFGIREPGNRCKPWQQNTVDGSSTVLVIVPGLAFTLSGTRLGRGRGYYDRFLSRFTGFGGIIPPKGICAVGFCYSCQLTGVVPVEAVDIAVNAVVSENGFVECGTHQCVSAE